jgi:hypothetical protein
MCGVSLQIVGEWWPWLISGVVQKVVGVGEIADAKDRGCELWLRSVFSCASPTFVHALLNCCLWRLACVDACCCVWGLSLWVYM